MNILTKKVKNWRRIIIVSVIFITINITGGLWLYREIFLRRAQKDYIRSEKERVELMAARSRAKRGLTRENLVTDSHRAAVKDNMFPTFTKN